LGPPYCGAKKEGPKKKALESQFIFLATAVPVGVGIPQGNTDEAADAAKRSAEASTPE
jgi:hypothetical protein